MSDGRKLAFWFGVILVIQAIVITIALTQSWWPSWLWPYR